MTEIDYALAWDFIDPADGKPRQLRSRRNFAPRNDPRIFGRNRTTRRRRSRRIPQRQRRRNPHQPPRRPVRRRGSRPRRLARLGHSPHRRQRHRPHHQPRRHPRPYPSGRPHLANPTSRGPASSATTGVGRVPLFSSDPVGGGAPRATAALATCGGHRSVAPHLYCRQQGSHSNRPGARALNPRPRRTTQAQ